MCQVVYKAQPSCRLNLQKQFVAAVYRCKDAIIPLKTKIKEYLTYSTFPAIKSVCKVMNSTLILMATFEEF